MASPNAASNGSAYDAEVVRRIDRKRLHAFLQWRWSRSRGRTETALQARFPGLKVVGTYTPPFRRLSAEEERELTDQVARLKTGSLLGGSQHTQARTLHGRVPAQAGHETHAGSRGRVRHSYRQDCRLSWLQAMGLQWLHRLFQDPKLTSLPRNGCG